MKHRLKLIAREALARFVWHTGLWRVVDRFSERRLTVLAGHCVEDEAWNGGLPADMKISAERLERLLRELGKRFELVTVAEGLAALASGKRGRSMVALSMDDGYRDNRTALLPLLQRTGARATIYLESRPLDERRVNWSHKYFWLLEERGLAAEDVAARLGRSIEEERTRSALTAAASRDEKRAYHVKRALKYEADPAARDAALDEIFRAEGGDESALCERLYMDWEDVSVLAAAGVELGGHTVTHEVLATLPSALQRREIEGGLAALGARLGANRVTTFAYPFGRAWDWNDDSRAAVRAAGFAGAVTTHAGTITRDSDTTRLPRWMIDDATPLHVLVAEASGTLRLVRRFGLELAE